MLYRMLIICALAGIVTGCAGARPGQAAQPQTDEIVQIVGRDPQDVVREFLEAWNQGDYERMYGYLSEQSRALYAFEVFQNRYTLARERMNLEGVTYTLNATRQQGVVSEIRYDLNFASPTFGIINDPNRIMRLVQVESGWQIAWSPLDIIDGFATGVTLQLDSRFPPRANIYDREDRIVVEQGGTIISISVIKQDMPNVDNCISLLSEVMIRSRSQLVRLFNNYNPDTFFHVGEIDPEIYLQRRDEVNFACGLNVDSGPFRKIAQYTGRRYFGGGAVTHITGYIGRVPGDQLAFWQARGYSSGDIVGRAGIEFTYDAALAGRPERVLRLVDPAGTTLRELGGASGSAPTPIKLTIDRDMQYIVEKAIADAFTYATPNWASVSTGAAAVVIDVNTGQILALASYPTFDPNLFNPQNSYSDPLSLIAELNTDPRRPLSNKAVQEQYTPGSVYKIFTAAAAANENIWQADELFNCELEWRGQERFGDSREFRQDWRAADELPPAGEITMPQALTASCNPFFWEVGALMFRRNSGLLADYSEQFGFGQQTGVRVLGSEASGNVARPRNSTEAINNAIGQGNVQTTALQMANAVATVANRGTLYRPYIVLQVGGLDGTDLAEQNSPTVVRTLDLDDEVYDVLWEGMCAVPVNRDLGTSFRVFSNASYSHCGKTGTAEAGARGSGVPPHAWYVSFAPRDEPRIAIAVVVTNSREGSEVAAPITRRILDWYFNAPIEPFPSWWQDPYVPLEPPVGVAG